jgi:phospholipid N-methyltransferase
MNDFIGNLWKTGGWGHFTNENNIYHQELKKVNVDFRSVLEIGPGNGSFAKEIMDEYNVSSYTFLDIPNGLPYLKETFKDSCNYVSCYDYKTLFDTKFDILISNICIPETPKEYREDLLSNILPNCKASMILGQLTGPWDVTGDYQQFIMNVYNNTYKKVLVSPINYKQCYSVIGYENRNTNR